MKAIKALLLDKKAELFEILGDIFNVTGHKLIVAKTEDQALDLLNAVDVDIILLPYEDRDFWIHSRKDHSIKGIYPMFIGEKEEELKDIIDMGFSYVNFIMKPFNPLDLLNRIGHLSTLEEHEDLSIFGLLNVLIEMEKHEETGYVELSHKDGKCILFVEGGTVKESTCDTDVLKGLFAKEPDITKLPIVEDFVAKEQFNSTDDLIEKLWVEMEEIVEEKAVEVKVEERLRELIKEVEEDVYCIQFRSDKDLLSKNAYLRVFRNGDTKINMLINPWHQMVWGDIKACIEHLIGDIKSLHIVMLLTQDVFKNQNVIRIMEINPKVTLITTRDIVHSMRLAGMPAFKTRTLDLFRYFKVTLATGHTLNFIPAPYTPYKGNFAVMEREKGMLYTSEIFSSMIPVSRLADITTFDPHGIKIFHMIHMPHSEGVKNFINSFEELPKWILPAYGSLLKGEDVQKAVNVLSKVNMGIELPLIRDKQEAILILNETLSYVKGRIDGELFKDILSELERFALIEKGRIVDVLTEPSITIDQLFISLCNVKSVGDEIMYDVLNFISEREVMLPAFMCL